MSSKSEYKGQPSWKPSGFKALGSVGREKVRERHKEILMRKLSARLRAQKELEEAARKNGTVNGVSLTDVAATMAVKESPTEA